jgi:hypothetical protein
VIGKKAVLKEVGGIKARLFDNKMSPYGSGDIAYANMLFSCQGRKTVGPAILCRSGSIAAENGSLSWTFLLLIRINN